MITATVRSRSVRAHERVDARFFTSPGMGAEERISVLEAEGAAISLLGDLAAVHAPLRFKRIYAGEDEPAIGYLRPYDVFEYLPRPVDHLSVRHCKSIDSLVVRRGQILQTCSGRNLGPCAYVDASLDGVALSHDMVRIEIEDLTIRHLVYAYLRTATAQALLRRGRSGSVVDHLTVRDVATLPVPLLTDHDGRRPEDAIGNALQRVETARQRLTEIQVDFETRLPPLDEVSPKDGWTVQSTALQGRVDVAFHAPNLTRLRTELEQLGGTACGETARGQLPVRYKRYYVEPDHGRPILSGRQILQFDPINLRYVSDRSFKIPDDYVVRTGETVLGAVGRSEGRLGTPAMVTSERNDWLASNDVMRLRPNDPANAGALWLSFASSAAQTQVKALPFGSVVDHMNPEDVESIILPPLDQTLGAEVEHCWESLAQARHDIDHVVGTLERTLNSAS